MFVQLALIFAQLALQQLSAPPANPTTPLLLATIAALALVQADRRPLLSIPLYSVLPAPILAPRAPSISPHAVPVQPTHRFIYKKAFASIHLPVK